LSHLLAILVFLRAAYQCFDCHWFLPVRCSW